MKLRHPVDPGWSKYDQIFALCKKQPIFAYTQPVYMLLTNPFPEIVEKGQLIHKIKYVKKLNSQYKARQKAKKAFKSRFGQNMNKY